MKPLTKKQFEMLDFLTTYHGRYGYMPTHVEISKRFKIKVGGATTHRIETLVRKGYIKKDVGPRAFTLIKQK